MTDKEIIQEYLTKGLVKETFDSYIVIGSTFPMELFHADKKIIIPEGLTTEAIYSSDYWNHHTSVPHVIYTGTGTFLTTKGKSKRQNQENVK